MAPLPSPRGAANDAPSAVPSSAKDAANACSFCLGLSVYSKAMADQRLPPRCSGVEVHTQRSDEFLEQIEERAGKARNDNFTLYGFGLTMYAPGRLARSGRLPVVRGLGVMVLKSDPDDLMRRMEDRKRVQRELDQERDDDDDIVEDLGDEEEDEGGDLVEKGPLGGMPKRPHMPPVLPVMTFDEFVGKSVDNSKAMLKAMYNFWAKRLDGFGERYTESCHRIVAQMDKQVRGIPATFGYVKNKIKELEDHLRRGGGDDDSGKH